MGKRLERREKQQQAVLRCAAELLSDHSAESVKITDLAAKMQCSVGGLYRYYPSKEAIFAALQIQALTELQRTLDFRIETDLSSQDGYSWSLVETLFDTWAYFENEKPTLANALNRFAWRSDAILSDDEQRMVGRKVLDIIEILEVNLQQLTAQNVLTDGDSKIRAYTLWGMVFGLLQLKQRQTSGLPNLPVRDIRTSYLNDLRRSWAC